MSKPNAVQLVEIEQQRSSYYAMDHAIMSELIQVRDGILPMRYADYFADEIHRHDINSIRTAHDDLTNATGKVFPLYVKPDNNSTAALDRAEKHEMIGYGYNDAAEWRGGPTMLNISKGWAWWLVLCASAVGMVLPDYGMKMPYFVVRDPRSHLPPEGWTPFSDGALNDTMFSRWETISDLERRYPDKVGSMRELFSTSIGPAGRFDGRGKRMKVIEWYADDCWAVVVTSGETKNVELLRSEEGDFGHPGVCAAFGMDMYGATTGKPRPFMADNIGTQVAISRLLSQELDFGDRSIYQLLFGPQLKGNTLKVGPHAYNTYDPNSQETRGVSAVGPAQTLNAERIMGFLLSVGRLQNRNPESQQGGGDADSAKAINALRAGVNSTVRDGFWPSMIQGQQEGYVKASFLDVNCFGNVKKEANGTRLNTPFTVSYTPNVDIKNRERRLKVEPGLGLGDYQATIELLQLYSAGAISLDDFLEQRSDVRDPRAMKKRIQLEHVGKVMEKLLEAKAERGELAPDALSKVRKLMANKDLEYLDAVAEVEQAGELTTPPIEPPAAPGGGDRAMGGMPPELAAMLGGGQDPFAQGGIPGGESLPSLDAMRGVA